MLDEQQQEFERVLRDLLTSICTPEVVRAAKEGSTAAAPRDLWRALTDMGVFGLTTEERFGGEGASLIELALVFQEAGRVLCPDAVTSSLRFGLALGAIGSDSQRDRWLRQLASGDLVASTALWDPANPRVTAPTVRAHRADGGWVLDGQLEFMSSADIADVLLVAARAGGHHPRLRRIAAVIDRAADGVHVERLATIADTGQCRVVLQGCRVTDDAVILGPAGDGLDAAEIDRLADTATALQCIGMVAGADAVIERTVAYVKDRHQFGRPLASFQALQHHIANVTIARELASVLTNQALSRLHRDLDARRNVAAAKLHCAEMYKRTTLVAHQLHGAIGFMREGDLHLWSERAKEAELLGGSADLAAAWLASDLELAS
jgi:alkylation response protein AidB-like acyl-CoA dehydrogenase